MGIVKAKNVIFEYIRRDEEGNVTYYRENGKTIDSIHFGDGSWYHYREDGKTLKSTRDKNGNSTYFQEDGKTVSCLFDNEGNFTSLEKIYYKNDEHGAKCLML